MSRKIICGKFDGILSDYFKLENKYPSSFNKIVRIGSVKFEKSWDKELTPASTNGHFFQTSHGKYLIDDFFLKFKKIIVLTIKEKLLTLDRSLNAKVSIVVFEELFPIFKDIRYLDNLDMNLEYLKSLINQVNTLGFNVNSTSLSSQLSQKYQYKVERALRNKSCLDSLFFFSLKPGYQEVFKLKEERKNRKIIALDFNSMFLDCMKGKFPDPKYLEYCEFNKKYISCAALHPGTYTVLLIGPKNGVFNRIHPFKHVTQKKSGYFNLNFDDEIETDLSDIEIKYFANFFDEIYIKSGIFSKKTIFHPLFREGEKEFSYRKKYHSTDFTKNLAKHKILMMHGCTSRKFYKKKQFKYFVEVVQFIKEEFLIDTSSITNVRSLYNFLKRFKIIFPSLDMHGNLFVLEYLNYKDPRNLYSLSSRVLAKSRIKMLKLVLKILEFRNTDLCYCNVDSVHLSLDESDVEEFLNFISPMLSPELGALKIESIATRGYWLDLGRYWLFDNNHLVKYSNSGFSNPFVNNHFSDRRKFTFISRIYDEYFMYNVYTSIYKSFSMKKYINYTGDEISVDNIDFSRYDHCVDDDFFFLNSLNGLRIRRNLFKRISTA